MAQCGSRSQALKTHPQHFERKRTTPLDKCHGEIVRLVAELDWYQADNDDRGRTLRELNTILSTVIRHRSFNDHARPGFSSAPGIDSATLSQFKLERWAVALRTVTATLRRFPASPCEFVAHCRSLFAWFQVS
jgi:hypothetical protein